MDNNKLNRELNVGDHIRLVHMDDPFSPVTVGTKVKSLISLVIHLQKKMNICTK